MSNKKTFRSKSSDHVPVIPTMVSTNPTGVKKIHVFRNGDVFFPGIQVVLNTHRIPDVNVLLDVVSEKIGLINGAKKLYTTSGVLVKDINKIKDNQNYVASSSHFTPLAYGGEKAVAKKKRSKSTKSKERKHKKKGHELEEKNNHDTAEILPHVEEEIVIPLNHEQDHKVTKKKKRVPKKHHKKEDSKENTETRDLPRRLSLDTTIGTAEVDLPSELEISENEHERRESSRGRPMSRELEPVHHERHDTRSEKRRDSVKSQKTVEKHEDEEEREEKGTEHVEKRRKSVSKNKSQPNWGDLSSFTQNIESLLKK